MPGAPNKRRLLLATFAACLMLLGTQVTSEPRPAYAMATLPAGFNETVIASGLASPTAMAIAPDGSIFVAEQTGAIRLIKNGVLLQRPFATVATQAPNERGLLGIALDPNFNLNRFVYVYYTVTSTSAHNRVSRFSATDDLAVAGSETVLLDLDDLNANQFHNGGAIHFGADGKLYIAVGENGVSANAQTLTNRLGKILRINPDGTIPPNPFDAQATGVNRAIWAMGLRNPYTFAVQPGTGRIFINDVGQSAWEEINDGIAGSNYGWPTTEGPISPPNPSFRAPVYAYPHGGSPAVCAITGGAFYNAPVMPYPAQYHGKYFFADICAGWIRSLDTTSFVAQDFASGIGQPVDLAVGPTGHLYYLARIGGFLVRINFTGNPPLAPAACTNAVLNPTTPSPYNVGSVVKFTAGAQCSGTANFRFWYSQVRGQNLIQGSPYTTSNLFNWNTTGLSPGTWWITVWVQNAGGAATSFDTSAEVTVVLQNTAACQAIGISASTPPNIPRGTVVSVRATTACGGKPSYAWWVGQQTAGGPIWARVTPYIDDTRYVWNTAGLAPGTWYIAVWLQNAGGSPSTFDAGMQIQLNLS